MPDLLIPNGDEELGFHERMLANRASMEGIHIMAGQDPAEWKDRWEDPDAEDTCFRLAYCDGCGEFVGDAAYRRCDAETADFWMMILGDMRKDGYGAAVLKQMAKEAKQHGIKTFRIVLQKDHPNKDFFLKRWFAQTEADEEKVVLCAETAELSRCHCNEEVCSLQGHQKQ